MQAIAEPFLAFKRESWVGQCSDMNRKNCPRDSFLAILHIACHRRPVQLENIHCQIHPDHIVHLPTSLFCGLHHISLAYCDAVGVDGNQPILTRAFLTLCGDQVS
jgi:hypothetical protein